MYTKLILFSVVLLSWSIPSFSQFTGDRRPTFGPGDPELLRGRRSGRMDTDDIERLRPDRPERPPAPGTPDIGRGPTSIDDRDDSRIGRGRIDRGNRELEVPIDRGTPDTVEDDPRDEFTRGISGSDRTVARTSEGRVITCESDEEYVPLSLVKLMSESGQGIEIESDISDASVEEDKKTITVKIPSYLGGCSDLKPKIHQDSGSNLVVVTVENKFPLDDYLLGKGKFKKAQNAVPRPGVTGVAGNPYTQEDLDKMTTTEKFEACMTIKKQLVPNGRGGAQLKWPKRKGYKTTLSESIPVEFTPNKDMKVVFGSPRQASRDYGSAYAWDKVSQVSINNPVKCLSFEEMAEGGKYLFDETDRRYANLQEDCEGNFLEVMKGLRKVVDFAEKDLFKQVLERELDL